MRLDAPQTLTVLSAALSAASPLSTPTEGTFAKSELTDPQTVAEIEYNVNRDGTAVTSLDFQVEDDVAKVLEGWNSDIFRRKGGDGGGDGGDGDGGDGDGHGDGTSGSKSGVSAASKHGPYLPNGERQSGGIPAVFLVDALAIEEEASHKRSNKPQKDGNLTSVTVDFTKLPHGIQYGFLKDTNDSAIDLADTLGLAQLGSAASFMGSGDANNTFDRGLFVVMPNNSILTVSVALIPGHEGLFQSGLSLFSSSRYHSSQSGVLETDLGSFRATSKVTWRKVSITSH